MNPEQPKFFMRLVTDSDTGDATVNDPSNQPQQPSSQDPPLRIAGDESRSLHQVRGAPIARGTLGVTERGVAKCIIAIQEHKLDLDACLAKGGAWAVAAERITGATIRGEGSELFANARRLTDEELGPKTRELEERLGIKIDARIVE